MPESCTRAGMRTLVLLLCAASSSSFSTFPTPSLPTTSLARHARARTGLCSAAGQADGGQSELPSHSVGRRSELPSHSVGRRGALAAGLLPLVLPQGASAAGLAERMRQGKAEGLSKRILPSLIVQPVGQIEFPGWMEGTWECASQFVGYELPVKKLDKKTIMADKSIAGFQKLSVVFLPDVGSNQRYPARWTKAPNGKVYEDFRFNLQAIIDNGLGYRAVESVTYDPAKDPARASVSFAKGKTRNAERIELFCNQAESETSADGTFVCAQLFRQVTYGLSQDFGVVRQEIGEFGNFWTFQQLGEGSVRANLLTAAYLQPQDPLFFEAPTSPVVVYANEYRLKLLPPRA